MSIVENKVNVTQFLSGQGNAIPLFKVFMPEEAVEASSEVLRSGYIGQGPRVDLFEEKLKSWFSSPHILTLNSGTSALHLALRLAGVGPGDEVISTPMTCMATNVPILANGARIVWADIDPTTGNISHKSVKEKIGSKTKAIMCVDWAGYPCDLDELQNLAHQRGIKLIQDAAHGFGSKYKDKFVGGIADFTCFSFQAIKHLTTVDGGALVCKNEQAYQRGKLLRWFGINRDGARKDFRCEEDVFEYGYKFHMNDVSAAIGLAQLNHVRSVLEAHRSNAQFYNEKLSGISSQGLELLNYQSDRSSSYWLYTIKVRDFRPFMEVMKSKGITVSQVHARNDHHTVFKAFKADLPGVDAFVQKQVSIPVGWWITSQEREYIAKAIVDYVTY
ncbi:MAG TPA: DegT/DnrJ/EryC1/StrS family aminotransferase [Rhabdochlamydiaceae bacterium]|nr:DegT/DnrJ/EryC1/StrS family aminotransferase [Rhabdochlamydiaceae bacterium]